MKNKGKPKPVKLTTPTNNCETEQCTLWKGHTGHCVNRQGGRLKVSPLKTFQITGTDVRDGRS